MFTTTVFTKCEGEFVGSLSRGKESPGPALAPLMLFVCVLRWNILQPRNKYVNAMDCVTDAYYYWSNVDIHTHAHASNHLAAEVRSLRKYSRESYD